MGREIDRSIANDRRGNARTAGDPGQWLVMESVSFIGHSDSKVISEVYAFRFVADDEYVRRLINERLNVDAHMRCA